VSDHYAIMLRSLDELRAELNAQYERVEPDLESTVDCYVRSHRIMARSLREVAEAELAAELDGLPAVARALGAAMRRADSGIPARLTVDPRPGRTRSLLYAYLRRNVGRPVPAESLRAITADQVHAERRVRELREYGLHIGTSKVAGQDCYTLQDCAPDLAAAAHELLAKRLTADGGINAVQREDFLLAAESSAFRYGSAANAPNRDSDAGSV
jgi:hypothetical protein